MAPCALDDAPATNNSDAAWARARAEGLARARAGAAAVLHVHVLKAGGAAACAAAIAAGVSVPPDGGESCGAPEGFGALSGGGAAPPPPANATPPDLLARVAATPWRFVGLDRVGLPPREAALASPRCAVWAVTLRDPRDRLLSHFYDLQAQYRCLVSAAPSCADASAALAWARIQPAWGRDARRGAAFRPLQRMRLDGKAGRFASFASIGFADFIRWLSAGGRKRLGEAHPISPVVSGDLAARHLCGFAACAPGACAGACLDTAKARLREARVWRAPRRRRLSL